MIKKLIKLYYIKKLLEDYHFDKTMTELENSINEVDFDKKHEPNFSNRFKDLINKSSKYEK